MTYPTLNLLLHMCKANYIYRGCLQSITLSALDKKSPIFHLQNGTIENFQVEFNYIFSQGAECIKKMFQLIIPDFFSLMNELIV